jgi:hypothetical protein
VADLFGEAHRSGIWTKGVLKKRIASATAMDRGRVLAHRFPNSSANFESAAASIDLFGSVCARGDWAAGRQARDGVVASRHAAD